MSIRNNYRGNNMIRTTQKVSTFIGNTGPTGATGPMSGLAMRFNTATADSDKDAGDVWLNATAGSETLLSIDDVDVDANDIQARINVWDDSTTTGTRGIVTIYQAADSSNWITMVITAAITDPGDYTKFTVTHTDKGGTIANNDLIFVTFTRAGNKGATGSTGATGGATGGLDYIFETATADSDQGTGKVWLNNTTRSSATILYIDDNDVDSTDVSAYIATWDDSTTTSTRGYVKIYQRADNSIYSIFNINGALTDATAYHKVPVSHLVSVGTIADEDPIDVFFSRTGNAGSGLANIVDDTSPQLGGDLDCNGAQIQWSKGADVASGTALAVLTDGNYFDVTGTSTIATINTTGGIGTQIKLHFDGILTLTNSADIVLPGGANITTAAGDEAEFIEYASGDYRCTNYTKASGAAVKIADESIDSDHYVDGSIDNAHIADDAIDSEHYADGSIDNAHIADDAIDSEHYAAGSIDTAHIATNQIDETLMKDAFVADFTEVTVATGDSILLGDLTDSGNTKSNTVISGRPDVVSTSVIAAHPLEEVGLIAPAGIKIVCTPTVAP